MSKGSMQLKHSSLVTCLTGRVPLIHAVARIYFGVCVFGFDSGCM
jgi:hypothetical protein